MTIESFNKYKVLFKNQNWLVCVSSWRRWLIVRVRHLSIAKRCIPQHFMITLEASQHSLTDGLVHVYNGATIELR
jgi:hypothetical protein